MTKKEEAVFDHLVHSLSSLNSEVNTFHYSFFTIIVDFRPTVMGRHNLRPLI